MLTRILQTLGFRSSPAPAAPLATRDDNWVSFTRGIGTTRDKTNEGYFSSESILGAPELSALYYNDDLAARVVDKVVDDAFARGVLVSNAEDANAGHEIAEKLAFIDPFNAAREALRWSRLFGGAVIIVGADDGQPLDMPLNYDRIRSVNWLLVLDRRHATPLRFCTELGPRFGLPEVYQVTSATGTATYSASVHASRVIQFDGENVDRQRRSQCNGFGQSVLQRPYNVLRDFGLSFKSVSIMFADASQGVFSLKGLIDAMASNRQEDIVTRMQLLDQGRSVARSMLIDADTEKFEKLATSFSGVGDVLDRMMMRLASAAKQPVSILMGRSAAGLNATGDLDLESWNKEVQAFQTQIKPALELLFNLCARPLFPRGKVPEFTIAFPPLGEDTAANRATVYSTTATADVAYINAGVLRPEQVAIARFGSGTYSLDAPKVDVDRLEAELAVVVEFDDPEDALPAGNPEADDETETEDTGKEPANESDK